MPEEPFNPVVVAPTYDNARTLGGVVRGVTALGLPLIVVNDGSTDDTAAALAAAVAAGGPGAVTVLTHPRNRGKAAALCTAFAAAAKAGHTHAVTIDTDGQHDPGEVAALVARARREPAALVLGSRDEAAAGYPAKSRLGRRLSNLFIRMESGLRVEDSQCGMRVYPLGLVGAVRCGAGRFGFETEVVTRAGWAGCPVVEVPVACRYLPPGERVSHLHPFLDTLRAVAMHARLLGRALLPWPRHPQWPPAGEVPRSRSSSSRSAAPPSTPGSSSSPSEAPPSSSSSSSSSSDATPSPSSSSRSEASLASSSALSAEAPLSTTASSSSSSSPPDAPRHPEPRKTPGRRLLSWLDPRDAWRQARRDRVGRETFSAGLAVGAFVGNLPFYGLHAPIGLYVARRLHLHPLAVVAGTQISTPPVGPLLNVAAIALGHALLHGSLPRPDAFDFERHGAWTVLRNLLLEWSLGSVLVGLLCATAVFMLGNRLLRRSTPREPSPDANAPPDPLAGREPSSTHVPPLSPTRASPPTP